MRSTGSRVKSGIFHHFHHSWIEELQRALNRGLLPPDYYAMAEQRTDRFGPDVLALDSPTISRRHARLELLDGTATVEDLGSKNGTFVNEERVASAQRRYEAVEETLREHRLRRAQRRAKDKQQSARLRCQAFGGTRHGMIHGVSGRSARARKMRLLAAGPGNREEFHRRWV